MGDRPVLGIDLGTTYSCVARLDEYSRPEVLQNVDGELTTPSVVYFEPNASVVVGEAAKNELRREPSRVVELIKRHMGEEDYYVDIDGESYLPQRISALILRSVVEGALIAAGESVPAGQTVADVVITVPAYFGYTERQATMDAGRLAGLNVVSVINEPTAAALAYRPPEQSKPMNVLVYDLGGGTFDVTVIQHSPEEVRVVATDGDHQLGGANWDQVLQDMLAEQYLGEQPDRGDPRSDDVAGGELGLLAEAAKRSLSAKEHYRSSVTAHGERVAVQISRQEYEQRTAFLLERTLDFTSRILKKAAEKGVRDYDAVLLVGGMAKSPAVARRLAETFPSLPAARLSDPDHIVAKGAALFAARSVTETWATDGEQAQATPGLPGVPPRIVNVSSKGYGVRAVRGPQDEEGFVAWLIQPNDALPCSARQTFRTVHHDQSEVAIRVYESPTTELDDSVEVNKELIAGVLEGLPPRRPPGEPVYVDFALGDDGILHILAKGDNGVELSLEARISAATPDEEFRRPLPDIQY